MATQDQPIENTTLSPPGTTYRETDRVLVVLTDSSGNFTGQSALGTIADMRATLMPSTTFGTTAPVPGDPGQLGQQKWVTRGSVADLWQYGPTGWVKQLEGVVLNPSATNTLPKPAPNTFADFQDTQAGGSVRLVPASGFVAADYKYAIGAGGPYQQVPIDGIITVGNITAAVYAYLPGTSARQQSDTAVSGTFTAYNPGSAGNVTPDKPTFSNFNDAANTVVLVPATGVPMSDYRYLIGGGGAEMVAPANGIINVGNVTAQVFAYSVAVAGRNQSLTAASQQFTATVTLTKPSVPTNVAATVTPSATTPTITVSFNDPTDTGGSPITTRTLYRAGDPTPLATGVTSPYTFNAVNGTAYTFDLTASNAQSESNHSAPSNTVTPVAPTPVNFNTTLNTANPNGPGGDMAFAAAGSQQWRYNTRTGTSGNSISLQVTDSSNNSVSYVTYNDEYKGDAFAFDRENGTTYYGTFPSSDTNFTA